MAERNELSIYLTAKTDGIENALRKAEARFHKGGANIAKSLSGASSGAEDLKDALDSVEFQKVADEARSAAATVTKSFDKAGSDLKQAFSAAGGELPASMARAKAAVSDFAASAKADLAKVGAAGKDAASDLESIADSVDSLNFANLADAATGLAEGFRDAAVAARDSLAEAGDGLIAYQNQVKATFSDTAAQAKVIAAGREIKDTYRDAFKLEGIGEAATAFSKFGASADQAAADLKRTAAVAKADGKDISATAEVLAEAFSEKAFDGGIGERIRGELGIGADALAAYGAKLDENKQLVLDSVPAQKAFQDALRKLIDEQERYAGAADRTKTAYGEAQAEVDKFKNAAAEQFNELREGVAKAALPFLKALNEFPDSFKTAAAAAALITPAVVSFGIGLGKVLTVAGLVAKNADVLKDKLGGLKDIKVDGLGDKIGGIGGKLKDAAVSAGRFATGTGGSVVAVAALAVTLGKLAYEINEYNKSVIDLEQAEQNLIATQSRAIAQNKERIGLQRVSAQSLIDAANTEEDAGKRRVALTDALIAKTILLDDARRDGNQAAQDAAQREVDLIERARAASDGRVAAEARAEADITAARRKTLDDSAAFVDELTAANQAGLAQRAADEAAAAAKKEADEKARQQRLAALLQEEQNLRRNALQFEREALTASDGKLAALEKQLEAGKDVTKEIEREVKARAKAEKALLDQEAILDRLALKQEANRRAAEEPDKGNRQKIYENAATAETQLNQKVAADKAKIDAAAAAKVEAGAQKKAQADEKAAKTALDLEKQRQDLAQQAFEQQRTAQEDLFAKRRAALEYEATQGQNIAGKLRQLNEEEAAARLANIQKALDLEAQAIIIRQQSADAGAAKDQQVLNAQKAALDLEKAQQQAARDRQAAIDTSLTGLQSVTAELLKQKQTLDDINKAEKKRGGDKSTFKAGAQTVEEAFGQNLSGIGVSRKDREAKTEDGKTSAELDAEIKRNQAQEANLRQRLQKPQQPSTAPLLPGPTSPMATIPNPAELAAAAKLDSVVKLLSQIANQRPVNNNPAAQFARGPNRTDGIDTRPSNDGALFAKRFNRMDGIY